MLGAPKRNPAEGWSVIDEADPMFPRNNCRLVAPTITEGSIPQSVRTVPSIAVVELFPCVPATATAVLPAMHAPNASA
jgi:hypothetical protein